MSTEASGLTRRQLLHRGLAAGLAVGAVGVLAEPAGATQPTMAPRLRDGVANPTGIHPFRVRFSGRQLAALRRRVAATRWPTRELVADRSQGVQLATAQALARFWTTRYDWRRFEAKLNALPQFKTEIDGVDIHFIHVKSRHENALPLIMTHGWPGSIVELLETVEPLTNPTAHGGRATDAFDLVLPSIPGYGFSGQPTELGWETSRTARAWAELMRRLGYDRYVAQGGDVGAVVTDNLGRQAPAGLLGIHVVEQSTRPQTIGYALVDSPVALAAWLLDHDTDSYYKIARAFLGGPPTGNLTRTHILDNVTLYWLTGTGVSAARSYWESFQARLRGGGQVPPPVTVPVAFSAFPGEIFQARAAGSSSATRPSCTTTSPPGAATSPPGKSRSCSPRSCGRRSGPCANRRQARRVPSAAGSRGAPHGRSHQPSPRLGPREPGRRWPVQRWLCRGRSWRWSGGRAAARLALRHPQLRRGRPLLAAAGYRVVVPYLRGVGTTRFRSDARVRNGEQAALAVDVIALLDALEIERAVVAGFDWGARTADIVAALWPDRCTGLVSVSGYLIGSQQAGRVPLPPAAELQWWYQYYFATERGRVGYHRHRRDFAKLIWRTASPKWAFDDATFDGSAAAFDNPDRVEIVIHNYRWRLGLADGEPDDQELEEQLAHGPVIGVPTITLEGDANGAPHPDPSSYAGKFSGPYSHRTIQGGIGHNLPQQAPEAFANAVLEVDPS